MKVILLKEVPKIGRKGEVKEVNQGYANNFLLPRGLAKAATGAAVAAAKKQIEKDAAVKSNNDAQVAEMFKMINKKEVTVAGKANDQGHLFSAIHASEITQAVNQALEVSIEEKDIKLPQMKEVGEYEVDIQSGENLARLKVIVEAA